MSPVPSVQPLSAVVAEAVEKAADAFDKLWARHRKGAGPRPDLTAFKPDDSFLVVPLLTKLICLDLQWALRGEDDATVGQYLSAFPELKRDPATVRKLLREEFTL